MTCASHAVSSVHEHRRGIKDRLSAETLHYHANGGQWHEGVYLPKLRMALAKSGHLEEHACPPWSATWRPPSRPGYRRATRDVAPLLDNVVASLRAGQLPIVVADLPRSFYAVQEKPWIVESKGPVHGSHAMVAVGLATIDDQTAVLVRNTWGPTWGDGGHAWLPASFLKAHLDGAFELHDDVTA